MENAEVRRIQCLIRRDSVVNRRRVIYAHVTFQSTQQWRSNRGFRRFNEPGPRAPGGPRVRGQKILRKKKYATSEKPTSSFSPWGPAEGIEGPQVTIEPGPLSALLHHWHIADIASVDVVREKRGLKETNQESNQDIRSCTCHQQSTSGSLSLEANDDVQGRI